MIEAVRRGLKATVSPVTISRSRSS
jgi:hypothetical protein